MPATVILGAQWGDEGKGKLVDRLAEEATWVARFQGGNNAGHTVVIGERVLKFHLLPSGITRQECSLVLGDGMVVDPWVLNTEIENWIDIKTDHLPWFEEFNKITSRKEISKLEKFLLSEANKDFVN